MKIILTANLSPFIESCDQATRAMRRFAEAVALALSLSKMAKKRKPTRNHPQRKMH